MKGGLENATFGAGCFWGVEKAYRHLLGVHNTVVGYMGGTFQNPTYEDVCSDTTGQAEVVQVAFNPSVISYEELLKVFWDIHDPTKFNRQGPDVGSQYRSVIFYHIPKQEKAAQKSKEVLERSGKYSDPIVTEIVPAQTFYRAEGYHQQYLEKHGLASCRI